ncbi:MAG TPA: ATP-binding protein, partial [Burkholderiales bacterium]|nr:ATP-binding protein [Burkholderiales bacterium]
TALHDRPNLMRAPPPRDTDVRREAEEELRRLAAERGEPPDEGAGPTLIIDREESAGRRETEEIAEILKGVERTTSRIWVVTRELRVLALAGSLRREEGAAEETLIRRVLGLLIPRPSEDFDDAIADDALATGREIAGALQGRPGFRLRNTPDGKAVVISAAHPIWNGDEVAGAVVVEESTNPILSVRSRALERLLVLTLAAFAVAAAVLIWFATRISTRIRRLRDEAETAIDGRGRLAHLVTAQDAGDEIGDLSRSFSAMLGKLSQHHAYLESLASRLSHELRTPIAVVRSSLENLKLAPADARVYIDRAEEGLRRLGTILTRMSEATRLEQGLASFERERFDLAAVVSGCVEGYRLAYPEKPFDLRRPQERAVTLGSPDLAAQLLDKFVANAVDFAATGKRDEPIRISLSVANGFIELAVENKGPPLPEEMRGKLFESMVSVRGERRGEAKSVEPHLGLGLYIARLIAEFHGGEVHARNLPSGEGVAVSATFRSA